jgi:hypothetical protein
VRECWKVRSKLGSYVTCNSPFYNGGQAAEDQEITSEVRGDVNDGSVEAFFGHRFICLFCSHSC